MNIRWPINLALAFLVTLVLTIGAFLAVNVTLPLILADSRWGEIGAAGCIPFVILGGAVRARRRSVAIKAQSKHQ